MKKLNRRRILLAIVALVAVVGLVVVSAVASVFAYRQFSGNERGKTRVDLGALQLGDDEQESQAETNEDQGVVILRIEPGSPAEGAGLSSGTVILSVNGQAVNSPQELKDIIGEYEVGDTVTLTIQDGEDTADVTVTLGDSGPYLGVNVGPAGSDLFHRGQPFGDMPHGFMPTPGDSENPGDAMPFEFPFDDFGIDPFGDHGRFFDLLGKSALVMSVVEDGPAAGAGLQAGDAIVEANGQAIENNQQLVDLISELAPGDELALQVQRGSETLTFNVTLASHPDNEAQAYLGVYLAPVHIQRSTEVFPDQQSS
ncbi:MAG: PDZ domain-containing protein [Chloroflexota bacterium]|jgi:S1-C subfamily serine protease